MRRSTQPLIVLSILLFIIALGLGVYIWSAFTTQRVSDQAVAGTTNSRSYKILKPATVPPKISECQQTLSYASNGNLSPVQCSNGGLNVLAWDALSAQEPKVMQLGYSPSQSQVTSAMCADASAANIDSTVAISTPLEVTAYELSSLYYGWNFNINPSAVLSSC